MLPIRRFKRCFSAKAVLFRISVKRDNGAGGPLSRIFLNKSKQKLYMVPNLYEMRDGLFKVVKYE